MIFLVLYFSSAYTCSLFFFFFQAEDGIRDYKVTGVQTCSSDLGETAEMPDTYLPGVVDVAGCMIGTASPRHLLDGSAVAPGDEILGLASYGLHTNGYSLARRVLHDSRLGLDDPLPGGAGETLGEALLAPHRWYGPSLWPEIERGRVHALAHVTGGGIAGNLVRVLPEGVRALVHPLWARPALFRWLMEE